MKELSEMSWAALSDAGEVRTSYELAARCIREGIPGDFVECGVFAGVQCAAMARAIWESAAGHSGKINHPVARRVHLFDSFEGIPEPGPRDQAMIAGGNKRGGAKCSLEQVKEYMRTWGVPDELLVYHRGWFVDGGRFRHSGNDDASTWPTRIAVLRLDLDLYDGTLAALHLLYSQLVPGGFCIVDDFALDGCRQACDEYFGKQYPPIHWQKPGGKA